MPDPVVSPADTLQFCGSVNRGYCIQASGPCEVHALLAVGERDKADAQLALDALPDPMHPELRKWADRLVDVQVLLATIAGHDDPGNVETVRAERGRDRRQIARLTEAVDTLKNGPLPGILETHRREHPEDHLALSTVIAEVQEIAAVLADKEDARP